MKVGLIRCMQTENMCPASTCLEVMRLGKGAFAGTEEEIICVGVNTCGGCPGKNAAERAKHMVRRGADTIAIASCITLGTPLNFPCPFGRKIVDIVKAAVGEDVRVLAYTHDPMPKRTMRKAAQQA